MNQEKIGSFISTLRKEKQLTQEQLGEKLGVSQKSISRWETGKNMPDISLLKPLSMELGITVSELIEGERQPVTDKTTEQSVDQIIEYTVKTRNCSAGLWNDINFITTVLIVLSIALSGCSAVNTIIEKQIKKNSGIEDDPDYNQYLLHMENGETDEEEEG